MQWHLSVAEKEHLETVCVFGWFVGEFSIGSSPLVQSAELGSVEKAALGDDVEL